MSIIKKIRKKRNIKFLKEHPTFCVLPFAHMELFTPGYNDIDEYYAKALCCSAAAKYKTFNSAVSLNESIKDVSFNNDRQLMLTGGMPKPCLEPCYYADTQANKRDYVNSKYLEEFSYKKVAKKPNIKVIDYRYGNECNLACRMCSSSSSTKIGDIIQTVSNKEPIITKLIKYGVYDNHKTSSHIQKGNKIDIENVKNILPQLHELQFAGGEPFISKDVEEILLEAIKKKCNKHIELEITTNGTKFIKDKLDIFLQFKKVKFIVSIDGVGLTYDYIRYPFSFSLIEKRLANFVNYIVKNKLEDKIELSFCCVGILYNLFDYEKLHNFLKDITSELSIPIDFSINPYVYSVDNNMHVVSFDFIPVYLLNKALSSFSKHSHNCRWYQELHSYIINRKSIQSDIHSANIKEYTLLLDNLHNCNYNNHLDSRIIKYIDSIDTK